jgi:hypothetical protein
MNQQDALFTFNLFKKLVFTRFEQAYCSSSGGKTPYIQQLVYVTRLYSLADGRIGIHSDPTNSQSTQTHDIPNAVNTEFYFLMMSSKPARNM